jgi:hypothetical protein
LRKFCVINEGSSWVFWRTAWCAAA